MKKLILMFIFILLIGSVSAFDWDNKEKYNTSKLTLEKYGKYEIYDSFIFGMGYGEKLEDILLIENTESCGSECHAIKEFYMYADGVPVSDVRFYRIDDLGNYNPTNIREYKFYISEKLKIMQDVFKTVCTDNISLNGTKIVECFDTKVGEKEIYKYNWMPYELGSELSQGEYMIKLEGNKNPKWTVDWQVKTQGIWTEKWATWGPTIEILSHNVDLSSSGATSNENGFLIVIGNNNIILNQIIKRAEVTTTTAYVRFDNGSLISTATFSANRATFTGNVTLDANVLYRIQLDSLGASYTQRFIASSNFPVDNVSMIWETGSVNNNNDSFAFNIISVNITIPGGGTVTLNSPVQNFFTNNPEVSFNISAIQVGADLVNISLITDELGYTEVNTTSVTGSSNSTIINRTFTEGVHNWSGSACDTDGDCGFATENRTFTIDTIFPIVNVTSPIGNQGTFFSGINLTLNWTAIDSNLDICWYNYEGINTTVTCGDNTTNLTVTDSSLTNLTFFANDTIGQESFDTTNWSYFIIENNLTFNAFTFETKTEEFIINITTSTPSSATFIYNEIDKGSAIITNLGNNNFNISKTIDIPIGIGNNSWFFNVTINSTLSSTISHQQSIAGINLTVCQSTPQNIPYINFSFKNETINQEDVTAFIDSSWTYFLGGGSVTKDLTFANSTEAFNYTFCFTPSNQTLSTGVNISYNNAESQQRISNLVFSTLTNVTTQQTLFLLPTTLGLFSQFFTQDTIGNTLIDVLATITRTLGGSPITVTSDTTDGSGLVVFFLNPDVTYTATFSKTGFIDNIFTFVPITDLRTVTMASTTTAVVNGSTISLGTSYEIQPINTSLNNNTIITFSFNVTNSQATLISMNITNSTSQLGFQSNAGEGFISENINTGNNTRLFGEFIIQTDNETITIKRVWFVGIEFVGDYSLFRQLTLFNDYGFDEFIKFLIVLSVIVGSLIFMSGDNQIEDEIKMAVITLIVWGFSIVNWLDTGVVIGTTSTNINALTQFSNQYGIAILTTAGTAYFMLRRIFREI